MAQPNTPQYGVTLSRQEKNALVDDLGASSGVYQRLAASLDTLISEYNTHLNSGGFPEDEFGGTAPNMVHMEADAQRVLDDLRREESQWIAMSEVCGGGKSRFENAFQEGF